MRTIRRISWKVLGTLGSSLLGNLLTGKGTIRSDEGIIRTGEIFNAASCFNKFWNKKVLSNWI